jgi:hypothetical protein
MVTPPLDEFSLWQQAAGLTVRVRTQRVFDWHVFF